MRGCISCRPGRPTIILKIIVIIVIMVVMLVIIIVITKIIIIIKVPMYFETELKCMQTKRENS